MTPSAQRHAPGRGSSPPDPRGTTQTRVAAAVVLLLLALAAAVVVTETLALRVPKATTLNYVEGFTLLDATRVAGGGDLYGDPSKPPWTVHVYTPVYTALLSRIIRLGADGLVAGRLLGYLSVLAVAALVALSGRSRTGPVAYATAAFYLTLPLFLQWGALVRPDNLAVLLSSAGLLIVDRFRDRRALYWAVPLFVTAVMTKQNVAAGLIAALIYLALRDRKRGVRFFVAVAATGVVSIGAIQLGSGGWFLFHTITANLNPFEWGRLGAVQLEFLRGHWPETVAGALLTVLLLRRRILSPFGIWFAVACLFTLGAGKAGSDTNYFLEPAAALAFLAAHELPLPTRCEWTRRRNTATIGALSLIAVAVSVLHVWHHHQHNARLEPADEVFRAVASRIAAVKGIVVSDDAGLLVDAGKPLVFRPFIMTQLADAGLWDESPFVSALEREEIELVVFQSLPEQVHHSRYTPAMREAISSHYRRVGRFGLGAVYEVHAPRSAGP